MPIKRDTVAPVFKGLQIPRTIDLSAGRVTVDFVVEAEDDASGLKLVYIDLKDPIYTTLGSGYLQDILIEPNGELSGAFTQERTFLRENDSGRIRIADVILVDAAGNQTVVEADALRAMGFRTSFEITGGTGHDDEGPVLVGYDIPDVIDLSGGRVAANFTLEASDDESGIGNWYFELSDPIYTTLGAGFLYDIVDSGRGAAGGPFTSTRTFIPYNDSGLVHIEGVRIFDKAGNGTYLGADALADRGLRTSFEITGGKGRDTTAPEFVGYEIPERIDLSDGRVTAPFTIEATDDLSGISRVYFQFEDSIQLVGGRTSDFMAAVQGELSGPFDLTRIVSPFNDPGRVRIESIILSDRAGNQTTVSAAKLEKMGLPTSFELVGTAGDDELIGGSEADDLVGGRGDDSLYGQVGHDLLDGGDGWDLMAGGWGGDVLHGDGGKDDLSGGAGDDVMKGGSGGDALLGDLGSDSLAGNGGADRFVFGSYEESSRVAFDSIIDFDRQEGDRIDLSLIDGDRQAKGDQALRFVGGDDFSGSGRGEVRYEASDGAARVLADVNGDGRADLVILVEDLPGLRAADFLL